MLRLLVSSINYNRILCISTLTRGLLRGGGAARASEQRHKQRAGEMCARGTRTGGALRHSRAEIRMIRRVTTRTSNRHFLTAALRRAFASLCAHERTTAAPAPHDCTSTPTRVLNAHNMGKYFTRLESLNSHTVKRTLYSCSALHPGAPCTAWGCFPI